MARHAIRIVGVLTVVAAAASCAYTVDVPVVPSAPVTSRILAADGSMLALVHAEKDRTPVALDEVSESLVDAVVAVEDHRFWRHDGVDLHGIARALVSNWEAGGVVEGGSTITQQYVKNVFTGDTETVKRKLREAVLARELEEELSKSEILERYLNTVYFGNGAYGVGAAARVYFGKEAGQLTLAESALLAGVIRAPTRYDPVAHPERAYRRRSRVLARMIELRLADPVDGHLASLSPLGVRSPAPPTVAPHFVEAVKRFVLGHQSFGATREERARALDGGGLVVETTLDPRIQIAAERAVDSVVGDPALPEAAIAVVEPDNGRVRALVGGKDFHGDEPWSRFDLATQGRRQAGSAFKPFALIAALASGASRAGTMSAPPELAIELPQGPWRVENYARVSDPVVTLEDALVRSLNTAYAQLVMRVGPDAVVDIARRMGVASPLSPFPSAVLGTNEVSAIDMATAYATLAGGGVRPPTHLVERILDRDGNIVYEHSQHAQRVLEPDVVARTTGVLRAVIERGTGRAASIDRPAAGKTGTTQAYRDAWFVGYTPRLAAAVWVGFADAPRSMTPPATPIRVTGGSWPATIWERLMRDALAPLPPVPFPTTPPPRPVLPDKATLEALAELADALPADATTRSLDRG